MLAFEVATPDGKSFKAEADSVQAPSVDGEFGVLTGHVPLLAALRPGVVRIRRGEHGSPQVIAVGPGFVEVSNDKVRMLTQLLAEPKDIDREGVRAELVRAEEQLRGVEVGLDEAKAQELTRQIEWCHARLDAELTGSRG